MIRVRDLPEKPEGRFLFCPECMGEYSAYRGDYFMRDPDVPFTCCDGTPLVIASKATTISVVRS